MSLPAIANVADVRFEGSLRIQWAGSGDSYSVRWRGIDDTDWTGGPQTTADDTGIDIAGLVAGLHYDFEIITTDAGSPPKIPAADSVPDYYGYVIPQGLTPPTECEVVEEGATQITISWKGDPDREHVILVQDDSGNTQRIDMAPSDTGIYTQLVGGLDPDVSYTLFPCVVAGQEVVFGDCYIDKIKACC